MPADLIAIGLHERSVLEDFLLGMLLVGDDADRAAAFAEVGPEHFRTPFRRAVVRALMDSPTADEALEARVLRVWRRACIDADVCMGLATFVRVVDDTSTAAGCAGLARRLAAIAAGDDLTAPPDPFGIERPNPPDRAA